MSYGNTWSYQAELAACQQWVPVNEFKTALRVAMSQNFSTSEGRRAAKTTLNNMLAWSETRDLVAYNSQFPQYGMYLNLSLMDWPNKIATMLQALDMMNPSSEANVDASAATSEGTTQGKPKVKSDTVTTTQGHYKLDDANHAFYQAARICLQQIGTGDACFNRGKFEQTYNLVWSVQGGTGKA